MAEITATMRQLLDQIGLSTPAELTSEQATNPHNPLLQLVNDLLKEALAEAGRAERAFGRRLRYLDQALYAEQHLLDQGQTPPGCPPSTPARASRNGSGWPPRSTR
jgi:hypothetical protein